MARMAQPDDCDEALESHKFDSFKTNDQFYTDFIRDDTYDGLRRHFCERKLGKGRPPALPTVESTNKLLLQLDLLRKESNSSLEQMTSWYRKLFPLVDNITLGRLQHKITMILKKADNSKDQHFLMEIINFDELCPCLLELHLTRRILLEKDNFVVPSDITISNEHVVALDLFRSKEGLPFSFVTSWLTIFQPKESTSSESQINYAAWKIIKDIKKLKKNAKETSKLLENFFPLLKGSSSTISRPTYVNKDQEISSLKGAFNELERDLKEQQRLVKNFKLKMSSLQEENESLKIKNSILLESQSILKTKEQELIQTTHFLKLNSDQLSTLKAEVSELEEKLNKSKLTKSKTYRQNTNLRKEIDHLNEQLKLSIVEKKTFSNEIFNFKSEINNLNSKLKKLTHKLKSEQTNKSKLIKRKVGIKKDLEQQKNKVEFLLNTNTDFDFDIKLRNEGRGRQFTNNVRLTYMALQGDALVSAENCAKVISIISKNLFDKDLDIKDLPKASSANNFQSEAHILSKSQIIEQIEKCKHFTFACDGTSRVKEHYLEQHIILDSGKQFSLGFSKIASDNSDTLLECCIDIFEELVEFSMSGIDRDNLFKDIFMKLKCLMSDRAEVMKCFDSKLLEYKNDLLHGENVSTHFLYCNAHFLLGLYAASEKAIVQIEKLETEGGERLGRDSSSTFKNFMNAPETAAIRLIRLASTAFGPRGDEKSGSRFEWLAYCSKKGIKSFFSSFRSNRFNNVFHNATALLIHGENILDFLEEGYTKNVNLKLSSIVHDLNDKRVISIIVSISLFHVFFTEPYWRLMLSDKSHGDFPQYVRKMEECLGIWMNVDDNFDFKSLSSVFEDFPAAVPPNYFTLIDSLSLSMSKVRKNFLVILGECSIVFERQLKDFLDGGVFGGTIADDVMEILKTCPLTNLTGERLFGDLDFDKQRRRNASLFSSSTKIMWKRNRTYRWVSKMTSKASKILMMKARKMGPEWRKRGRQAERRVLEKVKQRITENRQQKLDKEIKTAESKKEIIDWVIANGGICNSREELDELVKKKDRLKQIRFQIKARKVLYGESINSTGSFPMLYKRLVTHLGLTESELAPPPKKKRKVRDD